MINVQYTPAPERVQEVCDEGSVYKMLSVQLDASNLPAGFLISKLCPLAVDWSTKKAEVCKRARVYAAIASNGVSLKVYKGHPFKVGDVIGNTAGGQAITAITTTDNNFDTITIGTTLGAFAKGAILSEVESSGSGDDIVWSEVANANHLCYNRKVAVHGDSLTPIGSVYMIQETNLIVPVSAGDKESLTSRFMFI